MGRRRLRITAAILVTAFAGAPAAQAAVVLKGFSAPQSAALTRDLSRSAFPFQRLIDVTVRPKDLPGSILGLAISDRRIYLDPDVFRLEDSYRTFVVLHELSHQIDFQLLENDLRGQFFEAAGFGSASQIGGGPGDPDWNTGIQTGAEHPESPAEQFGSSVPLVIWPTSRGNPFVGADGTCIGVQDEGCRAPLAVTRAIVDELLVRHGARPLGGPQQNAPTEDFVPPKLGTAPGERSLRTPDPSATPVATSLVALAPLAGVKASAESVLHVRLGAAAGGLVGATVILDYQDKNGWWSLGELRTDRSGDVSYRFRPQGWRPTAFRVTFAGQSNLAGATVVVPVAYT